MPPSCILFAQNEKVRLTWADDSPIVANGEEVVAFKSTDKQYTDSRLFNPSSNTTYNNEPGGMGVVPDAWTEQYGEGTAVRKLPEIAALSSDAASQAEQIDRLRVLVGGGVNSNVDLKLLAELMPIGGVGKGTLLNAIKELAARDVLAVKGTEAIAGKAAETVAGKGLEKGPCCFAAGTKVSTPSGARAIESLKVGDVVWSKPEKGGKPFAAKILATYQRSDQPIYRLKLKSVRTDGTASGETLLVTPSHPFYVPAKGDFIPVINLKPGDLLQSLADGDSENTSSEVESLELYLPVGKTYNLSVDVGHTFYVGELKTWVHNTGPCDLPEGYFGPKEAGAAGTEVPVIKVNAGNVVKGSPEFDLLNNSKARAADTRYELDNGNSFKTNSAGQVEELTFTPVNTKVPRDSRQTEAGKRGRDTDVGGHAQACSQGGTCDSYNLFPQDANFNNSAYKVFYENKIKAALNNPGQTVGKTTIRY